MNVYITLDYEIFFGEQPGTAEKCILEPTRELIRIGQEEGVRFVFFVDAGYIIKLDEYRTRFPQLEKDYMDVAGQIKLLSSLGHDIQLHIHPHWEDSFFDGTQWVINTRRYKLADFEEEQVKRIFSVYKKALVEITGKDIFAFRAGGWCLQPFFNTKNSFIENGIKLDSTVYKGGLASTQEYYYDFRAAPDRGCYRFENDPAIEDEDGRFIEIPIASIKLSPLFFWRLFFLGRKSPHLHKPLGDGKAISTPGYRKRILTRPSINPVSVDGYFASKLNRSMIKFQRKGYKHLVVIGHPKALTRYSIQKIQEFVKKNKEKHNFTTFSGEFSGKI
jgi:hypothetical protein